MRTIKQFLLFLLVFALVATSLCSCDALLNNFFPAETEATTPTVTTPAKTPETTTPEVTTPEVTTPEVTEPEVTTPEVTEPEVTTPEVTEPEVTTPEVTEPEVTDPAADSVLTIEQAIALGSSKEHNTYTEGKYYVTGVIKEVYNTTYGNMRIIDEAGNILTIYGTYSKDGSTRYDALTVKPVAGDTVTIYGIVGQYNGTAQIKNGWIVDHVAVEPEVTTPEETTTETPDTPAEPAPEEGTVKVVMADLGWTNGTLYESVTLNSYIIASVTGTPVGNYALNTGKYYTSGTAWRIYQTEDAKLTITAADGKTIISVKISYTVDKTGILTLNGNNVESDTVVTVNANSITFGVGNTGTATNGQVRITAIEVVYGNAGELPEEPEVTTPEETTPEVPEETTPAEPEVTDPAADSVLTVEQAIALGSSKEHNTYTEGKYYVTGVITEVYNTTYGNMKIKDEAGNILTIYGTYSKDGSTRYDKMEVQPVAGDTVTIYGIVGQYNGVAQIKNGWITAHTAVEPEVTTPEETTAETPDTPAEPAPEEGTASVVIADYAAANGWTNSTLYDSVVLNSYIIASVTGTPTGSWGQNTGKYYTSGNNWRIYQNENPAITIAAADGKIIVSVKISYTIDKTGILTLNGANVESDTIVTVNANSITFSVGNTGTATNGQVRITAIEVVYGNAGELPEETTPEETTPEESTPEETTPEESTPEETTPEETTPEESTPEETTPEVTTPEESTPEETSSTPEETTATPETPDEPEVSTTVTVSKTHTDIAGIAGVTVGQNTGDIADKEIKLDDYITIICKKGTSTSNPCIYSESIRFYQGGATLTIKGEGMKTIVITLATKSGGQGPITVTGGTASELTNNVYTITVDEGASEVVITTKGTDKNSRLYVANIEVTYATAGSDSEGGENIPEETTPVEPEVTTPEETTPAVPEESTPEETAPVEPEVTTPEETTGTPETPNEPEVSVGGSADFDTIKTTTASGGDSSYTNSYTTTNGWVTTNSAIQAGGTKDSNPQFTVVGPDNTHKAVCLNGKVGAEGKLTSPTLTGGISKLTINYTKMFTDTQLSVTVTITDAAGNTYTHVIENLNMDKNDKYTVYTDEWVLETPIVGDFTIEIVNNCPSKNTGNKDRFTILDLYWN